MNNLAKRKFRQFNPNINELQNHHSVVYSDETGNENVSYSNKRCKDPRTTRFTIRMLEPGKIILALIPYLPINNGDVEFECVNGPDTGNIYIYTIDDYLCSQWIETDMWKPGDDIQISIPWGTSTTRFFSTYYGNLSVTSALFATGKFEVFGNITSLLFNWSDDSWKTGNYSKTILQYAFRGFFDSYDSMTITSSTPTVVRSGTNQCLVNAEDLYLPKLNVDGVYADLFNGCDRLRYFPKFFEVCDNENYCKLMCANISSVESDSNILIRGLNESDAGNQQIMNNMFEEVDSVTGDNAGNVYISNNSLDRDFCSNMFLNAHIKSIHISPGGATSDVITSGFSSITDRSKILDPVIWVDDIEHHAAHNNQTIEEFYNEGNCKSKADPYKYMGTVWVEQDCRSYYLWRSCPTNTYHNYGITASGSFYHTPDMILTTEKNFGGYTFEETGKIMIKPIKYYIDGVTMLENGKLYNNYTLRQSDLVKYEDTEVMPDIVAQDGYIPYETAGLPEICIDYNYEIYEDEGGELDLNYKYYSNDVFRCIGKLNNKYLFRQVYHELIWGINIPDAARPSDTSSRSYATSSTLNFEHTLLKDFTTDNYYNINILSGDMSVYRSDEDIFIIKSNGICPENCDYTIMS